MQKTIPSLKSARSERESLLDIIVFALEASGRQRLRKPPAMFPAHFRHVDLLGLRIEPVSGGYVANLVFKTRHGRPNVIGTSDALPMATYREAFLMGARLMCLFFTGSEDLPFMVTGDSLIVVPLSADGIPRIMERPFPSQLH